MSPVFIERQSSYRAEELSSRAWDVGGMIPDLPTLNSTGGRVARKVCRKWMCKDQSYKPRRWWTSASTCLGSTHFTLKPFLIWGKSVLEKIPHVIFDYEGWSGATLKWKFCQIACPLWTTTSPYSLSSMIQTDIHVGSPVSAELNDVIQSIMHAKAIVVICGTIPINSCDLFYLNHHRCRNISRCRHRTLSRDRWGIWYQHWRSSCGRLVSRAMFTGEELCFLFGHIDKSWLSFHEP